MFVSILGDSISAFVGCVPDGFPSHYDGCNCDVRFADDMWWSEVLSRLNATLLVNGSWSGSFVCKAHGCEIESYGCSDLRTGTLHRDGVLPDVILLFLGTNDCGRGFPCQSEDKTDLSAFENAYNAMLGKLERNYPKAKIYCITLMKRARAEGYNAALCKAAVAHGATIVDLSALTPQTHDGLHPTREGMRQIAAEIINQIKN